MPERGPAVPPQMHTQDVIEAFELLENWDARYEFINELGRELPPFPETERKEENLVPGCNTRAWLIGELRAGYPAVMDYRADSEGTLVRGLVALLLMPFQGKTPHEVVETDPSDFLDRLGLEAHLSGSRRMGMHAFIKRVKTIALAHAGG
jgi:cysteine desulfuration protein SufE